MGLDILVKNFTSNHAIDDQRSLKRIQFDLLGRTITLPNLYVYTLEE
jgi:hypothetical protein